MDKVTKTISADVPTITVWWLEQNYSGRLHIQYVAQIKW